MIISKIKAYTVLLYLSVLVLLINSYEITFLIWSFTAFVTLRKNYSVKVLELLAILFLVIVIAFFSSFFSPHKTYNFVRDIAYLLKPIIAKLLLGIRGLTKA